MPKLYEVSFNPRMHIVIQVEADTPEEAQTLAVTQWREWELMVAEHAEDLDSPVMIATMSDPEDCDWVEVPPRPEATEGPAHG